MFCGFFLLIILAAFSRVSRQTVLCPKGHWSPAPAGRVFTGQKISGLLFKISGSDFEIRATNFLFAPMRGKYTENQFSIFYGQNSPFSGTSFPLPAAEIRTPGNENVKRDAKKQQPFNLILTIYFIRSTCKIKHIC